MTHISLYELENGTNMYCKHKEKLSSLRQHLVVLWGFPAELPSRRLCLAPAKGDKVGHGALAQRDTWKAKQLRWKSLTAEALDGNIHPLVV
ncbi:hypothetical protein EK904_007874 [Melospiza melodia maxima]|nr:hypothetical protein EK904_007874 [Melospiza melodia maxima]